MRRADFLPGSYRQILSLLIIVSVSMSAAGCIQHPGAAPGTTAAATAAVLTQEPVIPEPVTVVPAAAATPAAPREVVTIVRYVSPVRDIRDTDLLFALQVPAEWNASTRRLENSDSSDYRTDLDGNGVFSVYSYPMDAGREQEFRDRFRQWSPAPAESEVAVRGIRYDRFESKGELTTMVAYLARTSSANERGYASVLVYTANNSNRFEKEDFEKVVASFRYFGISEAGRVPGEDIPLFDASGNALPRKKTATGPTAFSDWGGSYTGVDSSGDGGSSGGSGGSSGDGGGGSSDGGGDGGGGGGGCGG